MQHSQSRDSQSNSDVARHNVLMGMDRRSGLSAADYGLRGPWLKTWLGHRSLWP